MTPTKRPQPPKHLSVDARAWWRYVVENYDLEEHHRRLLRLACQAWDRAEEARLAIAEYGLTYTNRYGAPSARPEIAIERDARSAFARLVRQLDLEGEVDALYRR